VHVGSAVCIIGNYQPSLGSQQEKELLATSCHVLANDVDPRYSSLSPDQLRKKVHLRSRSLSFSALLRLRSKLFLRTHEYFMNRGYVHIDTPVFTANDCEGAGETFSIADSSSKEFFGEKEMFLSVSGQLHLEAMVSGISHVYTLSTGCRADKQQSRNHLTEFRMLEAEIAFCDNLNHLMGVPEDFLRSSILHLLNDPSAMEDFESLGLFSSKVDYHKSPVFVTHFPSEQKPFYMLRSADGKTTESFDLICPGVCELAGGSIREPSADTLRERNSSIDWYAEIRERGKPISGGFGLGFERLLQFILGVQNIKDTIPFPRWFKHCQC
ncbi:tRNA ligase class II, partial [Oesophagostomum dentatum]